MLNDAKIRAAKPRQKAYRLADSAGLKLADAANITAILKRFRASDEQIGEIMHCIAVWNPTTYIEQCMRSRRPTQQSPASRT